MRSKRTTRPCYSADHGRKAARAPMSWRLAFLVCLRAFDHRDGLSDGGIELGVTACSVVVRRDADADIRCDADVLDDSRATVAARHRERRERRMGNDRPVDAHGIARDAHSAAPSALANDAHAQPRGSPRIGCRGAVKRESAFAQREREHLSIRGGILVDE